MHHRAQHQHLMETTVFSPLDYNRCWPISCFLNTVEHNTSEWKLDHRWLLHKTHQWSPSHSEWKQGQWTLLAYLRESLRVCDSLSLLLSQAAQCTLAFMISVKKLSLFLLRTFAFCFLWLDLPFADFFSSDSLSHFIHVSGQMSMFLEILSYLIWHLHISSLILFIFNSLIVPF